MSDQPSAQIPEDEDAIIPMPDQTSATNAVTSLAPPAVPPTPMLVDTAVFPSTAFPQTATKRARDPYKNGACTHMTMTRLYTTEYGCIMCYRQGGFGWVYRCTQDRELLVEHGLALGHHEFFDGLHEVLPEVKQPRKRTPAARAHRLSLLNEIGQEQLDKYTAPQLAKILEQRSNVLDKAIAASDPAGSFDQGAFTTRLTKPWLPLQENECQYKCCPRCRPSMVDRTFLSLDGIVKGDIPATAVSGFGFHHQGFRPVANAKVVANLGLRESPPVRESTPEPSPARRTRPKSRLTHSSNLRQAFIDALGIAKPTSQDSPDIATIWIESLQPSPSPSLDTPTSSELHSESSSIGDVAAEDATEMPAIEGIEEQGITEQTTGTEPPLTPMEEKEVVEGRFGEDPLEVKDGVAVTEEAVGLRVADVITQL